MAAGNTHLSAQEHAATAKTVTVTTWPINQYQMTKTKPSKMQVSGSDRRTYISIDKLCVMFICSLPVTPEIVLSW